MTRTPLVSIVTPCLNPGNRLERCLSSVATQTYPFVEHIVVDGGSTDGTLELLQACGIRYLSEPDRGQTDAINKGFELAAGEWLGWLNADDVLTPRAIADVMAAVATGPRAGWAYGNCLLQGRHWERLSIGPAALSVRALERGNPVPQPGSLVARWALEHVGRLDERLHLAMDYDLWLRLFFAGVPAVYVPETLSIFEVHEESKTGHIPISEFVLEQAASLFARGRSRAGALMLGQAVAIAAARGGIGVGRRRLDDELREALESMAGQLSGPEVQVARASAYACLAEHELFARPHRFGYLLRPELWLVRETRRQLVGGVTRRLSHSMRAAIRAS